MTLETVLLLGSYAFTAGGYMFTYKAVSKLWEQISNHQEHRFLDIEERLKALEHGG